MLLDGTFCEQEDVSLSHSVELYIAVYMYIRTYMFYDEKEGRKKQARLNKQQGKPTQHIHALYRCMG